MSSGPSSFPCPCCGFLVFQEEPGSYDICPICGWEDDHVQLRYPALAGGANRRSLWEEQRLLLERVPLTVQVQDGHRRDPAWRPLKPDEIAAEGGPQRGLDYFNAAAEADTPLYYWRQTWGHRNAATV